MESIEHSFEKNKSKHLKELFPKLKGMNGGQKDHWLTANQDIWLAMYQVFDFLDLCEMLHTKPEILAKHLKEAEVNHRPLITRADKAELKADQANNTASDTLKIVEQQSEILESHSNEINNLRETIIQWAKVEAENYTKLGEVLSKQPQSRYFTEHIPSPNSRKVSLTTLRKPKKTVRINNAGRLLISTPGSSQLPGQVVKNFPKHKVHHVRVRWPYV